jgi:hypothetical protein
MRTPSNATRIKGAKHALKCYLEVNHRDIDELKTDIIDLVTDLFHLCTSEGIDYANVVYSAREHCLSEFRERVSKARSHGRRIKGDSNWMDAVRAQHLHDRKLPD